MVKDIMRTLTIIFLLTSGLSLPRVFAQVIADTTIMDKMQKNDLIEGKESSEMKVISASRSDKKLTDLPLTILVITSEEIQRNGYITLVDVLKSVGGIRTSQPGGGDFGEMFLMRGLIGNYYTKILLNSIPLQPSVTGALGIAEQLPIAQAEKIEIIFGPASAVYGADAMAGVVNIITKNPQNTSFAQANLVRGEYGYQHQNFMVGGKLGKNNNIVRYNLYGSYAEREDLNTYFDKEIYNPINASLAFLPGEREWAMQNPQVFVEQVLLDRFPFYQGNLLEPLLSKRPQKSHLLGLNINYRHWQFSYNEMYRQNVWSIGISPLYFSYNNPNAIVGDKIQRWTTSFNKDLERWSFTANLSYNRYRMSPLSIRASTYNYNGTSYKYAASDDIFAEVLVRYNTNRKWEWTLGVSLQYSSVLPLTNDLPTPFDVNDYQPFRKIIPKPVPVVGTFGFNPFNFDNRGIFLQTIKSTDKWIFIGGLRFDRNTSYGTLRETINSPLGRLSAGLPVGQLRISYQYNFNKKLSARASIGSGFKAPSPSDTYVSLGIPFVLANGEERVNYQQIPNTNLSPEFISSVELGMRYIPSDNFSLETIFYAYTLSQRIVASLRVVDTLTYPNAISPDPRFPFPVARSYSNDGNSTSYLASLQVLAKYKNILPALKLNAEASAVYSTGYELLPDDPLNPNDGGRIDDYRTMPRFIGHFNFDARPLKNWYIRIENTFMTSWRARFIVNSANQSLFFNNRVAGYHNMDLILRYQVSKNLQSYVRITNVFNKNFGGIEPTGIDVDLAYNPQLLRIVQLGLNFKLE